jgi:hypothetical protein
MHYKKISFSDIIGKRWPNVTKKNVTGKLAEALKPNLLFGKNFRTISGKNHQTTFVKKFQNYIRTKILYKFFYT